MDYIDVNNLVVILHYSFVRFYRSWGKLGKGYVDLSALLLITAYESILISKKKILIKRVKFQKVALLCRIWDCWFMTMIGTNKRCKAKQILVLESGLVKRTITQVRLTVTSTSTYVTSNPPTHFPWLFFFITETFATFPFITWWYLNLGKTHSCSELSGNYHTKAHFKFKVKTLSAAFIMNSAILLFTHSPFYPKYINHGKIWI